MRTRPGVAPGAKPLVAIVGRPNVGKSNLFNRLVGERLAIVEERPGTTRDRLYADTEWAGRRFTVIDTGGLVARPEDTISAEVKKQAEVAIAEADVILLLTDVEDGVVAADKLIASDLRRSEKPIILAVNKADNERRRQEAVAFYELGLGEPMPISALHGRGIGDLLDRITALLPPSPPEEEIQAIRMAIIGRPNVGKSSLLNAILGWERAIVHETPGTTRDALDTYLEWEGQPLVLIDTAGIRRSGRILQGLESYAVLRALRAIGRSDIALLVLDAVEGPTAQDAHIAGEVLEEGKGLVLAVNKWDLMPKDSGTIQECTLRLREQFKFLPYVPILFISALTHQGVGELVRTALEVYEARRLYIPTDELNDIVQEALTRHAPPTGHGQRLEFRHVSQVGIAPPTFLFSVNDAELAHFSYQRYLENRIRERYNFTGTPLRLIFRRQNEGRESNRN